MIYGSQSTSMEQRVPPDRYPWWVKLSRLGASSRRSQWFWVVFEFVGAGVLVYFAITEPDSSAVYLVFAALAIAIGVLSITTIFWMDRHGEWPR